MSASLSFPCLCLVTDRNQCNGRPLEDVVAQAVEGGVNMVQLREKDLAAGALFRMASRLRDITRGKALLFINDRLDVALACSADGVQLGEESLPLEAARSIAGSRLMLSRSVHSIEGAKAAESKGADLLVVGTIFPTGSHPGTDTGGTDLLEWVGQRVSIPYLAIGGIKPDNIESVIEADAAGAAVITAITRSSDPARASAELMTKMQNSWASTRRERMARQA